MSLNPWNLAHWRAPIGFSVIFSLALVGVQALCLTKGVPFVALSRDPSAHLNAPPYIGLLSNLGGMGWGAAAGLAAFGWRSLRHLPSHQQHAKALAWMFCITLILGLDDIALLHDDWIHRVAMRGGEKMLFLLYGLSVLAWLYRFRSLLMKVRVPLLMSVGCFALSITTDLRFQFMGDTFHHLFEDGFKLLGIGNWIILAAQLTLGPETGGNPGTLPIQGR